MKYSYIHVHVVVETREWTIHNNNKNNDDNNVVRESFKRDTCKEDSASKSNE